MHLQTIYINFLRTNSHDPYTSLPTSVSDFEGQNNSVCRTLAVQCSCKSESILVYLALIEHWLVIGKVERFPTESALNTSEKVN